MKQRSTTLVTSGFLTKFALVGAAVLMSIATPLAMMPKAHADMYDDKISALRNKVGEFQARASELSKQADTLQNELNRLSAEKAAIQTQIDLGQAKYEKLVLDIKANEQKIADNKDALGTTIADMYVDDSITPLEMLASSNNIGDYVDKQSYRSSVSDALKGTIETIRTLKKQLEAQKTEVEKVLAEQKNQTAALAAKEQEQAILVEKTKGEEAAYNQLASDSQSQLESAAAQQRAYYASLQAQSGGSGVSGGVAGSFVYSNWSGNRGCGGDGYPYCGGQDTYADPWALLNRECVSYAAWKIDKVYGKRVIPFNWSGAPHGNAYEWPQYAKGAERTYDPQPGDAVVLPRMSGFAPVGHLMVVENVSGDSIHVSQYNFFGTGEYSTMDIKSSGVIFLRFPSK